MKIYGIGTDVVNINRIKRSLKNKNFIWRLFNKNEINQNSQSKEKYKRKLAYNRKVTITNHIMYSRNEKS